MSELATPPQVPFARVSSQSSKSPTTIHSSWTPAAPGEASQTIGVPMMLCQRLLYSCTTPDLFGRTVRRPLPGMRDSDPATQRLGRPVLGDPEPRVSICGMRIASKSGSRAGTATRSGLPPLNIFAWVESGDGPLTRRRRTMRTPLSPTLNRVIRALGHGVRP
jgi:hypothetical protein